MDQYTIIGIIIFVLGLLIGSFLNVCIYRIPIGKTIVKGRSYCPNCNALIPWYLNIPLISFICLKGRCKNCSEPISFRYPAVELLTGLVFLLAWFTYGYSLETVFAISLFTILIVISFIDFDHQIIPDSLVIILFIIGVFHLIYHCAVLNENCLEFIIGFFAVSGLLFILGLLIPNSIGGGDIKLMAAAGLFIGAKLILLSLFIAALYASVIAIFIIVFKKGSLKTAIPFGPFLSLGIMTSAIYGESLITWYLSHFI